MLNRPLTRTRLLLGIALAIFLSAGALQAQQPFQRGTEVKPEQPLAGETQALWNIYERAVIDSAVYQRWNVRPLRPLTPDEHGQVLVAMVTSKDGKVGDSLTAGTYGMWVTGVPEVQTLCRAFHGDVAMQLRELLGLPPDADVPRVLVLKVAVSDLFRPAPDDSTNTPLPCKPLSDNTTPTDCGNTFPSTTTPSHYQWMAVETLYLHAIPNGYPWTHLGYTYNWTPGADRYGASEYVIRGGAKGKIIENVPTVRYCAAQ
ncbi:MAG TPA: hypothetical protein VN380_02000 [Thermoanaerobaculia bacterium]|jgi:hypothetical protein|nr:hypothetical protein [Thermoanaerobaculia bacterium]